MAVESDIILSTCEYAPESLRIIVGKDITEVEPGNISRFNIIKDYDDSFFPVIHIGVVLDKKKYNNIVKNSTTVSIQLKMRRIIETSTSKIKEEFINKIFVVYIDNASPYTGEKEDDNKARITKTANEDGSDSSKLGDATYDFFLFDDVINEKTLTLFNAVFTSANVTDIIGATFTQLGFSNILMEKLDNNSTYNEVVIPPLPIVKVIQYLDSMYGLYKEPSLLFFDTNINYLISKSSKSNAYRKKETMKVILHVRSISSSEAKNGGYFYDPKEDTYTLDVDSATFSVLNNTIINDQIDGNGRILVNPSSNSVSTVSPNTIQRGKPNLKVMTLKYTTNKFLESQIASSIEEESAILSMSLASVDIDILTPNKNFIIKFEDSAIDKEYGGKYRIIKLISSGTKRGMNFVPNITINLTR